MSHAPLLGTALRVGYLVVAPATLWWVAAKIFHLTWSFQVNLTTAILWELAGLVLVDALHVVMDRLM